MHSAVSKESQRYGRIQVRSGNAAQRSDRHQAARAAKQESRQKQPDSDGGDQVRYRRMRREHHRHSTDHAEHEEAGADEFAAILRSMAEKLALPGLGIPGLGTEVSLPSTRSWVRASIHCRD